MKNLIKLFSILLFAIYFCGCTGDFEEMNTNPKALTTGSLNQATYGFVVRKAIYAGSYIPNISFQIFVSLYLDMWANYQADCAGNWISDRYGLVDGWYNSAYEQFYSGIAPQVNYGVDYARQNNLQQEFAMMMIWKVWIYHRYTDVLGPIVYSEFNSLKKEVPYDAQSDVYKRFFLELDSAVTILKANSGKISATLKSADPIYAGNCDKWQKFGNSLRLRLAMRCKYVDPALAKTQAEKAVADGVIISNADNGWVATTVDLFNSYTIVTNFNGTCMTADMESILKGYYDPRVKSYYGLSPNPDNTDDLGVPFPYEGIRNGQTASDRSVNKYNQFGSNMAEKYRPFPAAGPPWFVMRAFEVSLLRAEGALEGWAMGGTAEDFYNQGMILSLAENGFGNVNLKGETYTTSTYTPASPGIDKTTVPGVAGIVQNPASTCPIAWLASGTKEQKLEQIATQKWIGLYPDSQEAYVEIRRTHYPILYARLGTENPDVPATSRPTRLVYGSTEYTLNKSMVLEAIQKLNAESSTANGDKSNTKLWWDKK